MGPGSDGGNSWEKEPISPVALAPFKDICKARNLVFRNIFVLDEIRFDEEFGEFRLPRTEQRHAEQTVPVTANLTDDEEAEVNHFAVAYKLADPIDAAILLNSIEIDVVLQCLESLIAFTEDKLGQYSNDVAEENDSGPTGAPKKRPRYSDQEEGDSYIRATLVRYPGFLNRVLNLTGSCHRSIRRRAIVLFGSLTEFEETVEIMEDLDWLCILTKLIKTEKEPFVMDWIILALKNLSKLCPPHNNIIRGGLLEKLLDLVLFDNQDPDVVQNTIEALCNLCASPQIRRYLALKGGFEAACELCLSEFPSTQYYALCLTKELLSASAEGTIDRFHEADGMSTIITLLNTEELKYLHASTLEVLQILLGVPVIAHELSKKKIYEFLLEQALSKTYQGQTDFQAFAARCISRAASFPDQRLIMNSVNIEKKILQLLTLPSYVVQSAALEAVGNLAKTLNCRRNFRKLDIVPVINKHLTSCDPSVREQAFFVAGTLILYESDLAEKFVKEGFLRHLQDTLIDVKVLPVCGLIDHALACVINLSETDALKEPLAKFLIKQIPELLTHPDESIKIKALLSAGILVRSDQEREAFLKNGGFTAIGELLKPPTSDNLFRHVCWAISVLAVQRPSIASLASTGCVKEILQARTSPNPLTSKYANLAVHRLASIHLAFKYALQNELDPDERIQHGFYCAEHIIGRNQCWSLKALMRRRNSSDTPVIVVSLPRKKFSASTLNADQSSQELKAVEHQSETSENVTRKSDEVGKVVSRGMTGQTRRSVSRKRGSKTRKKSREKLEVTKGERAECRPAQVENKVTLSDIGPLCKPVIPEDPQLRKLVQQVLQQAKGIIAVEKKISLIADIVTKHMGGALKLETLGNLLWREHLSTLCEQHGRCWVLLAEIKIGTFFHRALLFKVLADRLHLPVSLHRGGHDRAWDEVRLIRNGDSVVYIVDLMYQPGRLVPLESDEARTYMKPPISEVIPRQLTMLQNQLKHKREPAMDGCPVVIEGPSSEMDNDNSSDLKKIPVVTSWRAPNDLYPEVPPQSTDNTRPYFNTTFFTGLSAKEERRVILEDVAAAREAKRKATEALNAPDIITPKEAKEKMASIVNPPEVKKPVKLEYQVKGTQKWKSRRLMRPEQTEMNRVSVPTERPTVVRFRRIPHRKLNGSGSAHSGGNKTCLTRLTGSSSTGFVKSSRSGRSLDLDKKSELDVRKVTEDDEDIGEGFEVSRDVTDNLTYEDRLMLERWEMGLEDDVVGLESDAEET